MYEGPYTVDLPWIIVDRDRTKIEALQPYSRPNALSGRIVAAWRNVLGTLIIINSVRRRIVVRRKKVIVRVSELNENRTRGSRVSGAY